MGQPFKILLMAQLHFTYRFLLSSYSLKLIFDQNFLIVVIVLFIKNK